MVLLPLLCEHLLHTVTVETAVEEVPSAKSRGSQEDIRSTLEALHRKMLQQSLKERVRRHKETFHTHLCIFSRHTMHTHMFCVIQLKNPSFILQHRHLNSLHLGSCPKSTKRVGEGAQYWCLVLGYLILRRPHTTGEAQGKRRTGRRGRPEKTEGKKGEHEASTANLK